MPTPRTDESKEDFMKRCVPQLIEEGRESDQAAAICNDLWSNKTDEKLYTKAYVEHTEKGLVAVASSSVEDRHGEVVEVEGWDLKNFKKNPILQWAHDPYEIAIGTAKNIRLEGEGKRKKLLFEPVFHEVTEKARAIKKLFEDGILKAFSVGFRPLEVDANRYVAQELLEISAVNVPANQDALALSYKSLASAGFSDHVLVELGLSQQIIKSIREEMNGIRKELAAVKELHSASLPGRNAESAKKRQRMLKTVDKIAESLHAEATAGRANPLLTRALDKAITVLLKENKEEIHGSYQRTANQG